MISISLTVDEVIVWILVGLVAGALAGRVALGHDLIAWRHSRGGAGCLPGRSARGDLQDQDLDRKQPHHQRDSRRLRGRDSSAVCAPDLRLRPRQIAVAWRIYIPIRGPE